MADVSAPSESKWAAIYALKPARAKAMPKYCITEMSALGMAAIVLALSSGLWLAIAAVL